MKFDISNLNFCDFRSGFELDDINPLQKRRLSIPAKCIYTLLKNYNKFDMPFVFASNHGEINRCISLLSELSLCKAISPTSFSLSVLNSSLATFSINKNIHMSIFAISSQNIVEDASICAYSKLDEFNEICVICYDEVHFTDEFYSISFVLRKGNSINLEISNQKSISNLNNLENFRVNFGKNFTWTNDKTSYKWEFL